MAAAGNVGTGFSKPYVALYAASGGTVTYTSGQLLARGVDVTLSPESGSDNKFYADNVVAESAPSKFTNGTVTLTIDGLFNATRELIYGLPAATGGWTAYGDSMAVPYVGIGFIQRVQSEGVESFIPYVLPKCKFQLEETSAATQGEEIDWQTQALTADVFRADDTNHNWKHVGDPETTETAAETALKAFLGIN